MQLVREVEPIHVLHLLETVNFGNVIIPVSIVGIRNFNMDDTTTITLTYTQFGQIARHHFLNNTYATTNESPFTFEDLDESNSSYLREWDVYPYDILTTLGNKRRGIYRFYADSIIFTATME